MPRVRTNTSFTRPLGGDPPAPPAPAAAPDPSELFGAAPMPFTAMNTVRIPHRTVDLVTETIRTYAPLSIADVERLTMRPTPPFPPDIPRVAGRPAIGHRDGMGRGGTSDPNMILTRARAIHPSTFYSLIPTEAQAEHITAISLAAEQFARVIDVTLEASMDKDAILRKVREAALWARETVLRYLDGTPREMCSPNIPSLGPTVDQAFFAQDEANPGVPTATVRPEPDRAERMIGAINGD